MDLTRSFHVGEQWRLSEEHLHSAEVARMHRGTAWFVGVTLCLWLPALSLLT